MTPLEKMTDRYESIIEELEEKICDLETQSEELKWWANSTAWNRPRTISSEYDSPLPIPRLQAELTKHSEHHRSWFYGLVYEHLNREILLLPMGATEVHGGSITEIETVEHVVSALPFRMGQDVASDSAYFSLPAYVIVDGKAYKIPSRYVKGRDAVKLDIDCA